jgi:alkylhydroperoxidase family enzyme
MRLEPIDNPKGLMMRLAFWAVRRRFGKVMTPMKVFYTRVPEMMKLAAEFGKLDKALSLDHSLHYLLGTWVSQLNGCGFCMDIARAMAVREHIGMEKFNALADHRASSLFSERERAALAYAEESTRNKRISDATFAELRRHFNEREIVEITWLVGVENLYNTMNIALEIESDGLCAIAQAATPRPLEPAPSH